MTEQSSGRPAPALTEELRAQARKSPGSWLYSIDPAYDPDGGVPPFAIVGAWPVDERGEPGDFAPNPDYRPSPVGLGLPEPTDPVDAAMQYAATGHQPESIVLEAMVNADLYLLPEAEGTLAVYEDDQGPFVPLLTDVRHAPATAPHLQQVGWAGLLETLPDDMAVKINPGSAVSVRIAATDLRAVPARGDDAVPPSPVPAPSAQPAAPGIPGIPHKGGSGAADDPRV